MPRTRSLEDVRAVYDLKARGLTDRQVSSRTGVPVNTIRTWRKLRVPSSARPSIRHERNARDEMPPDVATLPREEYAYLLGMYLGDGCLARNGTSWTLRVALDMAYPGIIAECERAMAEVARGQHIYTRPASGGQ